MRTRRRENTRVLTCARPSFTEFFFSSTSSSSSFFFFFFLFYSSASIFIVFVFDFFVPSFRLSDFFRSTCSVSPRVFFVRPFSLLFPSSMLQNSPCTAPHEERIQENERRVSAVEERSVLSCNRPVSMNGALLTSHEETHSLAHRKREREREKEGILCVSHGKVCGAFFPDVARGERARAHRDREMTTAGAPFSDGGRPLDTQTDAQTDGHTHGHTKPPPRVSVTPAIGTRGPQNRCRPCGRRRLMSALFCFFLSFSLLSSNEIDS